MRCLSIPISFCWRANTQVEERPINNYPMNILKALLDGYHLLPFSPLDFDGVLDRPLNRHEVPSIFYFGAMFGHCCMAGSSMLDQVPGPAFGY